MRTRLRLGAAAAIGLGALLLATVLASPALAWHSNVDVKAYCYNNHVRVSYTVKAWEKDHEATVDVFSEVNGGVMKRDFGSFGPGQNEFHGQFDLAAGTTGEVTIIAVAHWKGGEKSTDKGSTELPPADKCEKPTTTTAPPTTAPPTTAPPTTAPPTTTPPSSSVSPTTSLETTTTAEVGAATSTTSGGGQLPFTGNSSGPMLLAGIVLVGGGSLFLLLSRSRDGHATK
jgi:LPXTG-motif cell wall-anchored protein